MSTCMLSSRYYSCLCALHVVLPSLRHSTIINIGCFFILIKHEATDIALYANNVDVRSDVHIHKLACMPHTQLALDRARLHAMLHWTPCQLQHFTWSTSYLTVI